MAVSSKSPVSAGIDIVGGTAPRGSAQKTLAGLQAQPAYRRRADDTQFSAESGGYGRHVWLVFSTKIMSQNLNLISIFNQYCMTLHREEKERSHRCAMHFVIRSGCGPDHSQECST